MAKIVIAGKAVVITSSMKLDDIKLVKKYRPEALILRGGEDGKEPIFALSAGFDGVINNVGACFADVTRDDQKLATITMSTNYDGDDIVEFVADSLGTAITNLNKLEETLPAVIEEIAAEKANVVSHINVIQ